MKILMITLRDGQNISLAKIADAFLTRGHEIAIYAPYYAGSVLKFFDKKIPKFPFEDLTEEIVSGYDIIFASILALHRMVGRDLLSVHKPIFTHNYLITGSGIYGGDFCFVPSLPTTATDYDQYVNCPKIGIGEPKYDSIIQGKTNNKCFLFIDSGHYPFGIEGKKELAKTLLDICESFPDYELWVKPRFLPGDEVITHKNNLHLYDVIQEESKGKIPENLVMLMEHRDLMELIDQCCTVLCMYTTAFAGAFVLGKGLVVLDHLPNKDIYDSRVKVFNRTRRIMYDSGAVIDYKRAKELLPEGVKCSEEYFRFLLTERENTADKICEVTEWLFETFYQKQIFPQVCQCDYKDYKSCIREAVGMTWDQVVGSRYRDILLAGMLGMDYCINAEWDVASIVRKVDETCQNGYMTETVFKQIRGKVYEYYQECIVENRDKLLEDDIDSGILLDSYYNLKQFDEIVSFPKQNIGAFHLFRGFVAYEQGDEERVILELEKYMQMVLDRQFIEEISDSNGYRFEAFYILIKTLAEKGRIEQAGGYLKKMQDFYAETYTEAQRTGKITDIFQGVHYTYLHWSEGNVTRYAALKKEFSDGPVLVYGAGVIGRRVVLKSPLLKGRIAAFIDKYLYEPELNGIPIIKPHEIKDFEDVHTIVVAVPHEMDNIKEDLLKLRSDVQIVSVNDLF